jgi:hypothetical protein
MLTYSPYQWTLNTLINKLYHQSVTILPHKIKCICTHNGKGKAKAVPLQAMKTYKGRRGTGPLILNLGAR